MKPLFFRGSVVPLGFLLALVACSSSNDGGTTNTTDASTSDTGTAETGAHDSGGNVPSDGSTNDVAAPLDSSTDDGGAIDSGQGATDGATAACTGPSDCVLYSSACETCACIPLGKNDPKPTCTGTIVTCFIDPCEGKTATCDNGHCGGNYNLILAGAIAY